MENSDFHGVWGFKIIQGRSVGGGLFTQIALEDTENTIESVLATRQGPGWFDTHGYLTLTDCRLIFSPYRWPLLGRPLSLGYGDIAGVEAVRRRNPGNLTSFVADALLVRRRDEGGETFWAAMPAEQLVSLIRERLASA